VPTDYRRLEYTGVSRQFAIDPRWRDRLLKRCGRGRTGMRFGTSD
jgi:hypothetical protein